MDRSAKMFRKSPYLDARCRLFLSIFPGRLRLLACVKGMLTGNTAPPKWQLRF